MNRTKAIHDIAGKVVIYCTQNVTIWRKLGYLFDGTVVYQLIPTQGQAWAMACVMSTVPSEKRVIAGRTMSPPRAWEFVIPAGVKVEVVRALPCTMREQAKKHSAKWEVLGAKRTRR